MDRPRVAFAGSANMDLVAVAPTLPAVRRADVLATRLEIPIER